MNIMPKQLHRLIPAVVLLVGGDKSTQAKDIQKATDLLNELED